MLMSWNTAAVAAQAAAAAGSSVVLGSPSPIPDKSERNVLAFCVWLGAARGRGGRNYRLVLRRAWPVCTSLPSIMGLPVYCRPAMAIPHVSPVVLRRGPVLPSAKTSITVVLCGQWRHHIAVPWLLLNSSEYCPALLQPLPTSQASSWIFQGCSSGVNNSPRAVYFVSRAEARRMNIPEITSSQTRHPNSASLAFDTVARTSSPMGHKAHRLLSPLAHEAGPP